MDMEPRLGKYHKDRHKPQAWYNSPLPPAESEALHTRLCQTFRPSKSRQPWISRYEWDPRHVYDFDYDHPAVWELPLVAAQPWFYVSSGAAGEMYRATPTELRTLPFTLRDVEMYFVPESFAWVLCQTHNPDYELYDPNGVFPELRPNTSE